MRLGKKFIYFAVLVVFGLVASSCNTQPSGGSTVGANCTTPPLLLPGALLSGCNLSGADLAGLNLSGADLRGANLSGADLSNSDLTSADLTGANLANANLTGADLTGAVLAGAILLGAIFVNALLKGTSFQFGKVFGPNGNGGNNKPTNPSSCTGSYCPGYNEVVTPTGPGRDICLPDAGGLFGPAEANDIFIGASTAQLISLRSRSVVTDAGTSFVGATFDYSADDEGGNGSGLLNGLNFANADFTDATFIDTYIACKVADGARFDDAKFVPGVLGRGGFFHTSMRNASFVNAQLVNHYFCDNDFTDATMTGVAIGGASLTSCPEVLPAATFNQLPDDLIVFDGADMSGATIGVLSNPSTVYPAEDPGVKLTFLGTDAGADDPNADAKQASFKGTNLDGVHFESVFLPGSDFTGASVDGATVTTDGPWNRFERVTFGSGWTNTVWSGTAKFDGAICPDNTIGSDTNPCFPVAP